MGKDSPPFKKGDKTIRHSHKGNIEVLDCVTLVDYRRFRVTFPIGTMVNTSCFRVIWVVAKCGDDRNQMDCMLPITQEVCFRCLWEGARRKRALSPLVPGFFESPAYRTSLSLTVIFDWLERRIF